MGGSSADPDTILTDWLNDLDASQAQNHLLFQIQACNLTLEHVKRLFHGNGVKHKGLIQYLKKENWK